MDYNLNDLNNENTKIKYGMQKKILKISETNPDKLYSDFDSFVTMLKSENNVMQWTGILVLGNLSKVDIEKKIDKVLPQIISKLNASKMITASNTVKSLIEIAKAREDIADKITSEILKVKDYKYDTDECSNIVIGHILKSIGSIWNIISDKNKERLIDLAKDEPNNSRPATAKAAILFLKNYN